VPTGDGAATGREGTDLPSVPLEADRGPASDLDRAPAATPPQADRGPAGDRSDAEPANVGGGDGLGQRQAGRGGGAYQDRGAAGRVLRAAKPVVAAADAERGEPEGDEGTSAVGRRVVLGMVGLGALGILVGDRVQGAIERALRPVSQNDPTGLTSFVPTAGRFRIYSVTPTLPSRSTGEYRLTVDGLVDNPLTLSYAQLQTLPQTDLTRDFQCVTGWRVPDVPWRGVTIKSLLDQAGVHANATHLRLYSFDGAYTESLTLDQARRDDVIVAHQMMGGPVSREHGGPVRLYVAPMYGYKSLKWLERIEVVDSLVPGYWEERGYDVDAWVGRSNGRSDDPTSATSA
jgi:DMSO/TMAO reductase YedYZ molybdopterin-dependent catalytic subunit